MGEGNVRGNLRICHSFYSRKKELWYNICTQKNIIHVLRGPFYGGGFLFFSDESWNIPRGFQLSSGFLYGPEFFVVSKDMFKLL